MAVPATHLSLCDGYGGWGLTWRAMGADIRTVARVERDAHAAAVLVARMADKTLDQAPIWDDVATFDGRPWAGLVDIITAGLPCQPFSGAGQRRGLDDPRHLWPHARRIIADVGPRFVILENVPDVVRAGWLGGVLGDLADLGFDAEWGFYAASDVGAPHRRQRFWLVAHAEGADARTGVDPGDCGTNAGRGGGNYEARRLWSASGKTAKGTTPTDTPPSDVADTKDDGRHRRQRPTDGGQTATRDRPRPRHHRFPPRPDNHDGWADWTAHGGPQPQLRRVADGATGQLVRPAGLADRLHLLGNGHVPQCAAEAVRQLLDRGGWELT